MSRAAAVLLYPGCIFFEVALAVETLAQFFEIFYFTPDGQNHRSSNGALIYADGSYADLETSDCVCVLVPGGNPDSVLLPENVVNRCLRANAQRGALLAGICAGNLILASTGLLAGIQVTHNYTLEYFPPEVVELTQAFWTGARYEKADVVVDRQFITAQPWAYRRYAAAVAKYLGVLTSKQATTLINNRP
jgi:transcriptional regulator GlxA family with amidase domain